MISFQDIRENALHWLMLEPVSRPNLPRCDCIYYKTAITILYRVGGPKET